MLEDLEGHVPQSRPHLTAPNLGKYLKDSVNVLIRQVGRFYQGPTQSKENGYVFYWFVLNLLWNNEQLIHQASQSQTQSNECDVQEQLKEIESRVRIECGKKMQDVLRQRMDENQALKEKLDTANKRAKELEQEAAAKDEEYQNKQINVAISPIMEALEKTYGKVREALNQTYDNQFAYPVASTW